MILLNELLDEDDEAAAQAKQMGLISKGWGRWADPRTGKVTHKTDGSRLVAVDPKKQEPTGGGSEPTSSKLGQVAKDLKGKVGTDRDSEEDDFYNKQAAQDRADRAAEKGLDYQVGEDPPKDSGNVGMGSSPEKDRAKLRNKFLKKGTADAARAKRLGDTRPHAIKKLSDDELESRMTKIGNYMDDLKKDMRGGTGSMRQKYDKAVAPEREAFKAYYDEYKRRKKSSDPSSLDVKGSRANTLKRIQSLRQDWKQKGNAEARATLARDFPKQYALDVVHQQGRDLSASIAKGMKGSEGKNPQWKKDAAKELRRHKQRVEKIRQLPDDTQFSGDMDKRRTLLDKLRGDGDDTVSGMKGPTPRIIRR